MISSRVEIKLLTKKEVNFFRELIILFEDVFEHERIATKSDSYLEKLLANPYFIVYIIKLDDEIIGGLTAYELIKYYAEASELFIYDIAIKPEYQRKGLGKKLLSVLKEYSLSKGINEIFVAAHQNDKQAVNFYNSTNGNPEKVIHFNYFNNKI